MPTIADDKAEAQGVVDKMTESFNHLSAAPNMGWFRSNLKNTKAATEDVLSLSRSKDLYGGVSLAGMVIGPKGKLNHTYYDQEVSPLDILVNYKVHNPGADTLRAAVTKMTGAGK